MENLKMIHIMTFCTNFPLLKMVLVKLVSDSRSHKELTDVASLKQVRVPLFS